MNNLADKKILSVGVYANDKKVTNPNKEKIAQKATRDAYRHQLEADMAMKSEAAGRDLMSNTTHPLDRSDGPTTLRDRHNENLQEEVSGGYMIGKDTGSKEDAQRRKDVQHRYLEQLQKDVVMKTEIRLEEENSPSKKVIPRRPMSPEVKGEFVIGAASSAGGEQKKEQSRKFYEMNQEEIQRKQMLKTHQTKNVDIDGRFAIGADEGKKKKDKEEASRVYLEALNKDLGDRDRGTAARKKETGEYVNTKGWSGLNIGGASSGNTKSAATLHNQKDKQAAYKRSLDSQMEDAAERQLATTLRQEAEYVPALPPYLELNRE
jgi:hypothetical protein